MPSLTNFLLDSPVLRLTVRKPQAFRFGGKAIGSQMSDAAHLRISEAETRRFLFAVSELTSLVALI